MSNLPTIKQEYAIDFNNAQVVATLKATVAKDLTNEEFFLFSQHCKSTGLNPFKKEVWAIKANGRLQLMTGINGFLAIANSHPQFDGMDVEVDDDAKPTKATCRVYRKDRKHPAIGVALMKEYGKETPIWRQMPRVMLTKVAKSIALREAFPQELNGMYTDDEMPANYQAPEVAAQVVPGQVIAKTENGSATVESVNPTADYVAALKAKVNSDEPRPDFLGFGKHAALTWAEVNTNYLEWLAGQNGKHSPRAIQELNRRAAENPQAQEDPCDGDDLPINFGAR